LRKKVKWPIVHFCMRKLMHRMNVFLRTKDTLRNKKRHKLSSLLKEEKLRETEFTQRTMK
jgi:hypothetical protein